MASLMLPDTSFPLQQSRLRVQFHLEPIISSIDL